MRQNRWLWGVVMTALLACNQPPGQLDMLLAESNQVDILISGGMLIDGTGQPAFRADLLIRGDSIVFLGEVPASAVQAAQTIDATGKVITPGFIDTHAHGNPLRQPDFHNFLAMGVTTICLGQDGYSPPFPDMGAWMDSVDKIVPGVNVAMFMGHGTLREQSGIRFRKNPSQKEVEEMATLLENGLQAGCFGMTTGLEYTPGMYAGEAELALLAKTVGRHDGMIMSHVRNEDDDQLEASLHELLLQGRHCKVHVSHMKAVYGQGVKRAENLLTLLDSARKTGIQVTADVYPYTASYTGIGIVFPDWALPPNNFNTVRRLKRKQLEDYLRKRITQRNGPAATLFGTAPFTGKTLAEVAVEKNRPFEQVLIDDIGPRGASAAYFVMNEKLQERLIQDSMVMVCSDGSPTMHHPRGYGSFAKVIEEYVGKKALFPLEEAIWKMTGLSAETIGVKNRGKLVAGMKADILVFDPDSIRAMASFDAPHQLARGMACVLVNGQKSLSEDTFSATRNGKVLRK